MELCVAGFMVDSMAVETHDSAGPVGAVPTNKQELGMYCLRLVSPALPSASLLHVTSGTRALFNP